MKSHLPSHGPNRIGRRQFLRIGGTLAAGVAVAPPVRAASDGSDSEVARRVIFLVSDGMSAGVPSLADALSRRIRGNDTYWSGLMRDSRATHAVMDTASADSPVTDSAAAASAWGCGHRVNNGVLNITPDGTAREPIMRRLRNHGFLGGLVTTATITHATPAGFAVCNPDRNDEAGIAEQYLGEVDILMGGGNEFFDPQKREDGRDLYRAYRKAGYSVCRNAGSLREVERPRMLGVFSDGHIPFTIDQRRDPAAFEHVPALAAMTRKALDLLDASGRGFLLQVEGARVDHAAHRNDAGALLWDQLAFDDAVGVALDFARDHPDTLVIVTTDHGNANPGLNGIGKAYADSGDSFARILDSKESYGVMTERIQGLLTGDPEADMRRIATELAKATGVQATPEEADLLRQYFGENPPRGRSEQLSTLWGALGQIIGNHTGIGWTGRSHTADYVFMTAIGPGSGAFEGLVRNDAVFGKLHEAVGAG